MGGGASKCPVSSEFPTGDESSHTTNVALMTFSWSQYHAQSLGLGTIIGVLLMLVMVSCFGARSIQFCLPKHERPGKKKRSNSCSFRSRRGRSRERSREKSPCYEMDSRDSRDSRALHRNLMLPANPMHLQLQQQLLPAYHQQTAAHPAPPLGQLSLTSPPNAPPPGQHYNHQYLASLDKQLALTHTA